ncbi:MAG: cysteine hydrolase family protein [Pseudomonadota bacterium]
MTAKTIFQILNITLPIGSPRDAALIVIDAQEEYRTGGLPLSGLEAALEKVALLQAHWRKQGGTLIHIRHHSPEGSLFDPTSPMADIMPEAAPIGDEPVLTKQVPNAFGGTDLKARLDQLGLHHVVLAGFMTHICVSTTARAASEMGLAVTVVGDAVTTRDLPATDGGPALAAADLHRAELAMLADGFAKVTDTATILAQG